MRISRIVLSVAWHVPPYISTLSHKRQDNRKQSAGNKMCVLISLQNLPKTFTILRRIKSDIITNIHRASCKVPFYNKTCVFWIDLEKYSYIKFHENPSTGRRFIPWRRTDRQTDMTKLIQTPRNFATVPIKDVNVPWLKSQACNFCIRPNHTFCFRQEVTLITGNIRRKAQVSVSQTQFMGKSDMSWHVSY